MFWFVVGFVVLVVVGRIASEIRDKEIKKEIDKLIARAIQRAKDGGYYYEGYPWRSDGLIDCHDDDVTRAVMLMHTHYFMGIWPLTFDPWG